ncbi:DNA repair family protein [Pleomassaria siparia CBS 279.74]|uniref:DNA repair family protein n=1 Tax=Pleomassaria siparia CBS 279.74 TaxID=1314801 RepID=A0A6G1JXY1_9PLEO|nr:DNA repair family protein [Pleomassaria siparia CBS 279.74]
MSKRGPLDSFFKPTAAKKPKYEPSLEKTHHASYPFAVPYLPTPFALQLAEAPAQEDIKVMNNAEYPDLDIVINRPYIHNAIVGGVFEFLRQELFFYRVIYNINRGGIETTVRTPRYTTVFGVDDTSTFNDSGQLVDTKTRRPIEAGKYKCAPRPLPQCLDHLCRVVEATTGESFNFCLVNYYADGNDSISYHSDDERFLGQNPAIASLSLGAKRDFYLKHKPIAPSTTTPAPTEPKVMKMSLGPGDMILMRGTTQKNWLHSIPKRGGVQNAVGVGRINITFRKALVKAGTENYYQYNVGKGPVFQWGPKEGKMMEWTERIGGAANAT